MDKREKAFTELENFRKQMKCEVSEEDAKYIWGKKFVKHTNLSFKHEHANPEVERKVKIAKESLKYLRVGNMLKFVGISGSVAAGFAKKEDDIDVFIVVKNDSAWIYRGIIAFRNIFHRKIRVKSKKDAVMDKLCVNFICEERDLKLESDIFNFHELMYLIPVYNERYLNYIYSQNDWLRSRYEVKGELLINRVFVSKRGNWLIRIINLKFFVLQVLFMVVFGHEPELDRLWKNYKRGRIEFFPGDFKKEIIK